MRGAWIALLLMLAGCAGTPVQLVDHAPGTAELAATWHVEAADCRTAAVFFLVDHNRTHDHLPPGFHAGDLSGFLYHTAVTSGRVPAFVATSTCTWYNATEPNSGDDVRGELEIVYLGFYVDAPEFAYAYANKPSDYNFYVVSYLGPALERDPHKAAPWGLLAAYGWAHQDAAVTLEVVRQAEQAPNGHPALSNTTTPIAVPDRFEVVSGSGSVSMQGADVFEFSAHAFFPQAFDPEPSLRFWHAGPEGIGFLEFDLGMRTIMAGPVDRCLVAPGTIIADVVGAHQGGAGGSPCGLTDTFSLVFDRHDLVGQMHHMQGAHPI